MELESQLEGFRKRGLNVAALSYDSVEVLKDFASRRRITYPLLSDPESKVIRGFGIVNDLDYPVGHLAHGVPFPGTFIADAKGVVQSKFFEKMYSERRTAASVLTAAGDVATAASSEIRSEQFVLKTSASNATVAPGHRVTLVLDVEMAKNMHAYAPGDHTYRPLTLILDANPLITPHDLVRPKSEPYTFKPLNETVPVYAGTFRILQDVTVAGPTKEMQEALKAESPSLDLTGTLSYQVCSESVCYAPAKIPVRWTLKLIPLDRERAPEPLRKKP